MKKRPVLRKTLAMSVLTLFLVLPSAVVFAAAPAPPPPPEPVPEYLPPAGTSVQQLVTFRADHSYKYLCVETTSGGQNIKANRNIADDWVQEMFIINGSDGLRDGTTVNIRTTARHYFSAQEDGDLDADRIEAREWERFKLINLSNPGGSLRSGDLIGLKSFHGKYVRVNRDDYDDVDARNTILDQPWEMFTVNFLSDPQPLPEGNVEPCTLNYKDGHNTERYFDVYIPADLSGPAPLLVDMHGYGSTKEGQRDWAGFKDMADREGFIAVWPQAFDNGWNVDFCCPPLLAFVRNIDDAGFLRSMVFWIAARADVDLDRVYATGQSNGGGMAIQLALLQADVFAAIAPIASGSSFSPLVLDRSPSRPVPALLIHGWYDPVVLATSALYGNVETGFHYWATSFNGCEGCWEYTHDEMDDWSGNCPLSWRKTYNNCDGGVKQEMLMLGMGHASYDGNEQGVDITRAVWDFLSQWSMP